MSRPSRSLRRGKCDAIPENRELVTPESPLLIAYGDGIDGLLGMSFLSRFNINIDGKTVRISPRTAR